MTGYSEKAGNCNYSLVVKPKNTGTQLSAGTWIQILSGQMVWVSSVVYVFRAGINLSLINIARELNRDVVVQAL